MRVRKELGHRKLARVWRSIWREGCWQEVIDVRLKLQNRNGGSGAAFGPVVRGHTSVKQAQLTLQKGFRLHVEPIEQCLLRPSILFQPCIRAFDWERFFKGGLSFNARESAESDVGSCAKIEF